MPLCVIVYLARSVKLGNYRDPSNRGNERQEEISLDAPPRGNLNMHKVDRVSKSNYLKDRPQPHGQPSNHAPLVEIRDRNDLYLRVAVESCDESSRNGRHSTRGAARRVRPDQSDAC